LAAAIIASAIIVDRTKALFVSFVMQDRTEFMDRIRELVLLDKVNEAIAFCESYRKKPLAIVVREGLLRAHQPEVIVEDGLQIAVSEASQHIQKRTPFLSTIANVATLLGLLGTISGLIQAFNAVGSAAAQDKGAMLSQGISTAMNATMMGLAVAIPCMLAFSFFTARANKLCVELEQGAFKVLDLIRQKSYAAEVEHGKRNSTSRAG
jgi:biopolymer transport protein ExbB/TolQ